MLHILRALVKFADLMGTWAACLFGLVLSSTGYWKLQRKARRAREEGELPYLPPRAEDADYSLLSVIIPAHNEARSIAATLRSIDENVMNKDAVEVIVVDACSSDGTREVVEGMRLSVGLRVVDSASGRAAAQNAGVEAARGGHILLVHSDVVLPPGFDKLVFDALSDEDVVMGAFRFAVKLDNLAEQDVPWGISVMAGFANFRSENFLLPYGDQSLFFPRSVFRGLGGFPPVLMMEDFNFIGRVRFAAFAHEKKIKLLDVPCWCSPRRWQKNGVLLNTLLNQLFVLAYVYLNVSDHTIYRWYYGATAYALATADAATATAAGDDKKTE